MAYGSPDYFREVKNQISRMSPTIGLDFNLPSSIFSGLYGQGDQVRSHIKLSLDSLYSEPGDFKDWVDATKYKLDGNNWSKVLASKIESELWNNLDSNSEYYTTLESYIEDSLDVPGVSVPADLVPFVTREIASELRSNISVGQSVDEVISLINNNPTNKLDKVPPDTIIPLEDSVPLNEDLKGIPFELGYLTLADYYNDVAYPKMTPSVNNLPSSLNDSARWGYVGYSPYSLESLFNPGMSSSLRDENGNTVNVSLPQALEEISSRAISRINQSDQSIYNISLLTIDLAGFTSYDPSTMSNGDFLDPNSLPKYDDANMDPDKGNPFSSRDRATAF